MTKTTNDTPPTTEEEWEARARSLETKNAELEAKVAWYEEQFRLSQQQRFGSSSEKSHPDQMELPLFNEAETTQDSSVDEPTLETVTYQRKKSKGTREQQLDHLPVETIDYHLTEDDQVCSCCSGALHAMSTEVRQELKIIPAEVRRVRHVRHVYSCRFCERSSIETPIITAPMPKPVYPGSLASSSAVAHILQQKYVEGMPLYRQEKQLERLGVTLSRQTLANWVMYSAETWLRPIYDRMKDLLLQEDILHADETTVQVLKEAERSPTSSSYMWLYRNGRDRSPNILYDYRSTRASKHPQAFLKGFKGYLHVDGYPGYNNIPGVRLVGCWAHARRKFDEALKAMPAKTKASSTASKEGLAFCNRIFAIERQTKDMTSDQRLAYRQAYTQPVLDAFSAWLQTQASQVLPKSALGEAIKYARNQWDRLVTFMEDGRLDVDNNRSERSMKPFVIGRKNWLFSQTPRGAQASAIIYSIIETAKENHLHPFPYLTYLFETLPQQQEDASLDEWLPWSTQLPERCRIPVQS